MKFELAKRAMAERREKAFPFLQMNDTDTNKLSPKERDSFVFHFSLLFIYSFSRPKKEKQKKNLCQIEPFIMGEQNTGAGTNC